MKYLLLNFYLESQCCLFQNSSKTCHQSGLTLASSALSGCDDCCVKVKTFLRATRTTTTAATATSTTQQQQQQRQQQQQNYSHSFEDHFKWERFFMFRCDCLLQLCSFILNFPMPNIFFGLGFSFLLMRAHSWRLSQLYPEVRGRRMNEPYQEWGPIGEARALVNGLNPFTSLCSCFSRTW